MGCNIDGWITANTGWTNFIHLESAGSYLYGATAGSHGTFALNGAGALVHAICALPP